MQARFHTPPTPADLTHLRPSNAAGSAVTLVAIVATVIALTLDDARRGLALAPGQIILAVALVQWFAILHECGHETLFRSRSIHRAIGQVAGFFSIIPFYNWKRVHGRHHK
jgi:omega-6 fatty acid desaturase (delta-12 desaturase)